MASLVFSGWSWALPFRMPRGAEGLEGPAPSKWEKKEVKIACKGTGLAMACQHLCSTN